MSSWQISSAWSPLHNDMQRCQNCRLHPIRDTSRGCHHQMFTSSKRIHWSSFISEIASIWAGEYLWLQRIRHRHPLALFVQDSTAKLQIWQLFLRECMGIPYIPRLSFLSDRSSICCVWWWSSAWRCQQNCGGQEVQLKVWRIQYQSISLANTRGFRE